MKKHTAEAVIITVGTIEQKKLCEKLLSDIREKSSADIFVVSDEDFGGRIGSGGALLGVLEKYYEEGKKLLVINSGGMSKRSINYAVRGKLFANLFIDGKVISLLELFLNEGENLFSLFHSGVVVCCGDIPVKTDCIKNRFTDNTSLAVRTDFQTGSRHGVMFCDENNFLDIYPHKISSEKLEELSREYGENGVLVDTGTVYFTGELCTSIKKVSEEKSIIKNLSSNKVELNLYSDIISLLAKKTDKNYFSVENETHGKIKEILRECLSRFSLKVLPLEGQKFIHMGTLGESLVNIFSLAQKGSSFLSLNSFVDNKSVIGDNTVLDNAILENCRVGKGCIISDITLENCHTAGNGKAVCGIKLRDGSFVAVVTDVDENPKEKSDGIELWEKPRFYRGKTYTESYNKFASDDVEEKISMAFCTENADTDYYFTRCRYIKDSLLYKANNEYLTLRDEIINRYFSKQISVEKVFCKKERAEICLPVRVNLSGTWTDAMPYCVHNGGEVVNMAVTVDGEKPIKVTAEKIEEKRIEFFSDGVREVFSSNEEKTGEELSEFNLHRAVLTTVGINEKTAMENGFRLKTEVSSLEKGSGLGVSSILLGGCFKVLGELLEREYTEDEIFEMVFVAEQLMKTGGGWQDQAGGLTTGIKVVSSSEGIEQKLSVRQINLSENFKSFISERLVLIPTGERHFGRFIVSDVSGRYLERNEAALQGYDEIKNLNEKVLKSIEKENFEAFANCINEHFMCVRKISPAVSNKKIDCLSDALLEKYVDAVSVCGAGGGGYLLAVMKNGVKPEDVNDFIKNKFAYISEKVRRIDIFY